MKTIRKAILSFLLFMAMPSIAHENQREKHQENWKAYAKVALYSTAATAWLYTGLISIKDIFSSPNSLSRSGFKLSVGISEIVWAAYLFDNADKKLKESFEKESDFSKRLQIQAQCFFQSTFACILVAHGCLASLSGTKDLIVHHH